MEKDRWARWVTASHAVGGLVPTAMAMTIQGLGRIDVELYERDLSYRLIDPQIEETYPDTYVFNNDLTLSYLWILGAYENIRSLSQALNDGKHIAPESAQRCTELKKQFARIRVPLAKYEAAKIHQDTDFSTAYPITNSEHGIGWQIGRDCFLTRGELATAFLTFLEWLKQQPETEQLRGI